MKGTSESQSWDERYRESPQVWRADPHEALVEVVSDLQPGHALDVATGEGRHAVWLAEQGWQVTAVDFAGAGLERGRAAAAVRGVEVDWVLADVRDWRPEKSFDLVLVAFLHVDEDVWAGLRGLVAPGGHLVSVGHARRNLTDGVGGPRNPDILHDEASLRAAAGDFDILRLAEYARTTDAGTAIDIVLDARRPT